MPEGTLLEIVEIERAPAFTHFTFSEEQQERMRLRVMRGIAWLDARDPDWRDAVMKNLTTPSKETRDGKHRGGRARPLDELNYETSLVANYCKCKPECLFARLGLSRKEAEGYGMYFAEANPHCFGQVIEECRILSLLWNAAVFGKNVPLTPEEAHRKNQAVRAI